MRELGRLSPEASLRKARAAWAGAKARCAGSNPNYGGRGIRMSPRWLRDFEAFVFHVGFPIVGRVSIDRINNNRGYQPGNVRWATSEEQAANTRGVLLIAHEGVTRTQAEWARLCGVTPGTMANRLDYLPRSVALTPGPIARSTWAAHRRRRHRALSRYRVMRAQGNTRSK